jgi:hypothetical protein
MSFELLPNEVWLEIFKFLKTGELLNAFCCLNARFNKLLFKDHFNIYGFDFRSTYKENFDFICQHKLSSISEKIPRLCLSDDDETPYQSKIFLAHGFILNQFISLTSLSLYEIRSGTTLNTLVDQLLYKIPSGEKLNALVHQLSPLPNLTNLELIKCHVEDWQPSCNTILNKIWSLPKLTQLHFDVHFQNDKYLARITTPSLSIQRLIIKGISCCLFELSKLFECTPNLDYISIHSEDNDQRPIMPIISSLTKLDLYVQKHTHMIMNLLQNTRNLRQLRVRSSGTYLDGHQWENIINNHLPQLEKLQFEMSYSDPSTNFEQTINQLFDSFRSPFWLEERQWYVRCHWIPGDDSCYIKFYTIPYAFSSLYFINQTLCQSTDRDTDDNWSYKKVKNLSYDVSHQSRDSVQPQARFPNVRHLEVFRSLDDAFWMSISELNKLQSLEISSRLPLDSVQSLLDQTPKLHSLILYDYMRKLNNTSIRRLDLLSKCDCLNNKQCEELSRSSLITRCEVLLIKIANAMCLSPLIENMPHLRALKIQCRNDNWIQDKSVANNKLQ